MGQEHSRLQYSVAGPAVSAPVATAVVKEAKRIVVVCGEQEMCITLTDHSLTTGWLLSEAIRRYRGEGTLVALRTELEQDVIDVKLLMMSSPCTILHDCERLIGIIAGELHTEPIPTSISQSHFAFTQVIGRGGYSTVFKGEG